MIEHIVLSGGAYKGLYELGCLKYLNKKEFYQTENIKSIHGTSIGGLIGSILCLNMDWDDIITYFVKRPWHKLTTISSSMFFDAINTRGLLNANILDKVIIPLLNTCDIDENVTLLEFYNKTNIELYLYTIEVNAYECISLSYKTHPDLGLLKSIQMTCALPYLFQPVIHDEKVYIDGGFLNNYPINDCIKQDNANANNILSIKFPCKDIIEIKNDMNILEYGYLLYRKSQMKSAELQNKAFVTIENEISISCLLMNLEEAHKTLMDESERKKYIDEGEKFAVEFLFNKMRESIDKYGIIKNDDHPILDNSIEDDPSIGDDPSIYYDDNDIDANDIDADNSDIDTDDNDIDADNSDNEV